MTSALTTTPAPMVAVAEAELLTVEARRAARVMMRKSSPTQRTYQGSYERFAGWLAEREGVGEAPVSAFTSEAFITYLERWRELREEIFELAGDPYLFPRLGRRRRDGRFPDAGGQLSTTAVIKIVRPIMLQAGVSAEQAHPHTLRHTFGRLYMAAPERSSRGCSGSWVTPPRRPPAAPSTTRTTSWPPSTAASSAYNTTRSPAGGSTGGNCRCPC